VSPTSKQLRLLVKRAEDWWFDATRSVRTSEYAELKNLTLVGEPRDRHMYLPVRVKNARTALDSLPIGNLNAYTFIDLGSGRGRMLFIAAEYPFRRILGVEFATELHRCALENIERYRSAKQRCHQVESVNIDAVDYQFPDENLVVYLFNPFGPTVFEKVLNNLKRSLDAHPRHMVIVLIYPELAPVLDSLSWLRNYQTTARYHIYQTQQ
jgi:Methyltransferase domain